MATLARGLSPLLGDNPTSSLLVMRSTIVVDILRTLHGTIPCHPIRPAGVSGHRLKSKPTYSSGEKIIFTARAFVSQLSTPATTGMVQYSTHCAANLALASAATAET